MRSWSFHYPHHNMLVCEHLKHWVRWKERCTNPEWLDEIHVSWKLRDKLMKIQESASWIVSETHDMNGSDDRISPSKKEIQILAPLPSTSPKREAQYSWDYIIFSVFTLEMRCTIDGKLFWSILMSKWKNYYLTRNSKARRGNPSCQRFTL